MFDKPAVRIRPEVTHNARRLVERGVRVCNLRLGLFGHAVLIYILPVGADKKRNLAV